MESKEPRFNEILTRLADRDVRVIVVGMAAAVIQGVPTATWDLDVVHERTPENVDRLLRVLGELNAVARADPRKLQPDASHPSGPGHVLMETQFGDCDCLGAIDGGRGYEDLIQSSVTVDFAGRQIRVLSLGEILAIKKRAGRPKDLAAIPYIESTIEELESGS